MLWVWGIRELVESKVEACVGFFLLQLRARAWRMWGPFFCSFSPGAPCPVAEDHNLTFSWLQRPSLSFSLLKLDGGTRAVRVEVGRKLSGSVEKLRPPLSLVQPAAEFRR